LHDSRRSAQGYPSQTGNGQYPIIFLVTPDSLARAVQEFLSASRDAVVMEDGGITFDLATAKYSISGEHGKCLLHLWSAERNVVRRCGNISTRLVHCPDESAGRARFAESVQRIKKLISEAEVNVLSPGEVAFRLHGLEFARARVARDPRSFCAGQEIVFGLGAEECVLEEKNFNQFHTSCVQRGRGTPSRRSPG